LTKLRYQQLFWDNDGVLVETEQLYFEANRTALAAWDVELSTAAFRRISLELGQSVLDLAAGRLGEPERCQLRQLRDDTYVELLRSRPLLRPGVPEILAELHGRIGMGIVTSSRRTHFDLIHAATGILGYFDFILVREDYRRSKPHPDPYLAALQRTSANPLDCLVVEDTPRGLQAAHQAGLDCLVLPNPLLADRDFPEALALLQDLRAVIDFLGG